MLLSKACWCDKRLVALGSGHREEEEALELEYASEGEVFGIPVPDLMTLVLEGNAS